MQINKTNKNDEQNLKMPKRSLRVQHQEQEKLEKMQQRKTVKFWRVTSKNLKDQEKAVKEFKKHAQIVGIQATTKLPAKTTKISLDPNIQRTNSKNQMKYISNLSQRTRRKNLNKRSETNDQMTCRTHFKRGEDNT